MQMTCPKCQGAMRQYERNGITIDQCTECRGLFLDRGELERLMDAEAAHYGATESAAQSSPPPPPPPPAAPHGVTAPQHAPVPPPPPPAPSYGHGYGYDPYHKRKKRKSFLEDFLDF